MERHRIKPRALLFCIGLFLSMAGLLFAFDQNSPIGIDVIQPKTISIGSFFYGEKVAVRAVIPSGAKAALRLLGPREDLALMRKGRVSGLWMNVEQIHFRKLPKVYLLWTSDKLAALEPPGASGDLPLNYEAFLAGSLDEKKQQEEPLLVSELIKLKEADHLYQKTENSIRIRPLVGGMWEQADAVLELPSKIYPGSYSLELIAIKDGKKTLLHTSTLEVKL
ncbi:MAG TPA: TIGR02186 family protein, partial [Thermodesulfobacteriota bacterium]|nr:TIGR02186 family protein [Thermodesulfobacteriota bacterium]